MKIKIPKNEKLIIASALRPDLGPSCEGMTDEQILQSYIADELESRRADGHNISEDDIISELRSNYIQSHFEIALNLFITNHPYYKFVQGTQISKPTDGRTEYQLHDPDGDYEKIQIIINYLD